MTDTATTPATSRLDLDAYLGRLGVSASEGPGAGLLRRLQRAHLLAIPFENGESLLSGGTTAPSLALPALTAKLLRSRRGGYCYEHNLLFAAALRALGFQVTMLAARVLLGARPGDVRPRTHMGLRVRVPGEEQSYLADTGFGTPEAPLTALSLTEGEWTQEGDRTLRLVRTHTAEHPLPEWELHSQGAHGWERLYGFTEEPFAAPDFDVFNWHIATNPRSPFARTARFVRILPDGGHRTLLGRTELTLVERESTGATRTLPVSDGPAALRVLADRFDIVLPEGSRLLAPGCGA